MKSSRIGRCCFPLVVADEHLGGRWVATCEEGDYYTLDQLCSFVNFLGFDFCGAI